MSVAGGDVGECVCVCGGPPKVACITGRSRFGHSSGIMNLPFLELFTATAVVDKKEKTPRFEQECR